MANLERLRIVRDKIAEVDPALFCMSVWGDVACKTPACMVGYASILFPPDWRTPWNFIANGVEALGLSPAEEEALCYTTKWPDEYRACWQQDGDGLDDHESTLTPEQKIENRAVAIRLLDAILERGEIWWAKEKNP